MAGLKWCHSSGTKLFFLLRKNLLQTGTGNFLNISQLQVKCQNIRDAHCFTCSLVCFFIRQWDAQMARTQTLWCLRLVHRSYVVRPLWEHCYNCHTASNGNESCKGIWPGRQSQSWAAVSTTGQQTHSQNQTKVISCGCNVILKIQEKPN